MRKTILMLINGFGIERNGSANIYSGKLMPNLDAMTREYLFGSLVASAGDYNTAYKNFSIPEKNKKEEDEIDNLIFEKKLSSNVVLNDVKNSIVEANKLHGFYYIENEEKWHQVREFLKIINGEKNKKVYVHLVLFGTSTNQYDSLDKVIGKLSFEMGEYCKLGIVVGKNKITTDDFLRTFYKEFGEHWNEPSKKLDILKKEIINPEDASVFSVNPGFQIAENDSLLFLNFENAEIDRSYNDFTKIPLKIFSLYEFKDNVPHMFSKNLTVENTFSATLEKHGIDILLFTDKNRLNDVNFYLNGMQNKLSPKIKYAVNDRSLFSSKQEVINTIENSDSNGFIIDYDIGSMTRIEDIKDTLSKIDGIIKNISDASKEKDYTFIISSLYGMHAPAMEGVVQKVIDFSGKVPCIYQNNEFNRKEYSLNGGNTYSLNQTYLTNICDDVKENKLVHKLSSLEKMLSKK